MKRAHDALINEQYTVDRHQRVRYAMIDLLGAGIAFKVDFHRTALFSPGKRLAR